MFYLTNLTRVTSLYCLCNPSDFSPVAITHFSHQSPTISFLSGYCYIILTVFHHCLVIPPPFLNPLYHLMILCSLIQPTSGPKQELGGGDTNTFLPPNQPLYITHNIFISKMPNFFFTFKDCIVAASFLSKTSRPIAFIFS